MKIFTILVILSIFLTNVMSVNAQIMVDKDQLDKVRAQIIAEKERKANLVLMEREMKNSTDSKAQTRIGMMYYDGDGVAKDYSQALKWFRLAAGKGDSNAQEKIGLIYVSGNGVIQDFVQAHMWYNIASANGEMSSMKLRDDLAVEMTREDISKAQAMAQECIRSGYKNCEE